MHSPLDQLTALFNEAARSAFPELLKDDASATIEITQSTQEKFGHYQCNSAMKLTKTLRMPPREVAQRMMDALPDPDKMIAKMEIAGPGFINIHLRPEWLSQQVETLLLDAHLGIPMPEKVQRIIVEFSSPNIAKELHVGHLRSTIIGDCLARLFEFLGHDVIRLNHVGDWGTAFGMLIAHMKETHPHVLTGEEQTDLTHLVQWYKESKQRFDSDPDFKKRSQLEVVALQGGEPQALKAWKMICEISERAYREIYDLLDIHIEDRGESFYNPMLPEIISDLESKGLITVSEGAKCVFMEGFTNREGDPLPLMVQKSDGGYNYDTTDMAAIRHRIEDEKADRIIYVTDAGQSLHFKMIFACAELAGYLDPSKTRVDHVTFGLVLGSDGKKFRTRSGETEKLIELLETAVDKARVVIDERAPAEISEKEREQLAKVLGIGAVKYADLSCNRSGDYTFSYDRMLRFEGNTAVFLLYAYVRVAGIKRKVQADIDALKNEAHVELKHPAEIALGMHLAQFHEALDQLAHDLLPNRLTEYLYGLAEKFNRFFHDCRVEGTPEQDARLLLCEATAKVLKQGLEILGVQTVERM